MSEQLKISVIVNSYNYDRYISETLDSVVAQTLPVDEIVIVDDGSTDASCAVIVDYVEQHSHMKFIRKENGGQLSAFNVAAQHVTGDIVFFIDSDDIWRSDYIERIVEIYRSKTVDFVFCAYEEFGESNEVVRKYARDKDLGYSVAYTYFRKKFIGGPTATISLRSSTFFKIFPVDLEEDWRISADLPLVVGASLAGARKYYCASPLVLYRIHKKNAHKVHVKNSDYDYKFYYNREKTLNYFTAKFFLNENSYANMIEKEISTSGIDIDNKTLKKYLKIVYAQKKPLSWKIKNYLKIVKKLGRNS
ncbi:MAG: glycosyltransferase family 2 protein [Deltaproteobacteria bacterium HGW-Deltaproteobacteria-4]|nr:MAG: glycosyltransferase family 2 protein [Deltaproteobacteria bacterium HGW-Deltaproteobacteria-4]